MNYFKMDADDPNLRALTEDAIALVQSYPNDWLLSVGQSPAWLCYSAQKCRTLFNREANGQYISFSGRFFQPQSIEGRPKKQFKRYDDLWPTNAAFDRYIDYLHEQECTPRHAIDRFAETGQKTILIDKAFSGCGMASFLYAWLRSSSYAPELLRQAITIHLCHLASDETFTKAKEMVLHPSPLEMIDLTSVTSYAEISNPTHMTGGGPGETDVNSKSTRLVPSFDISRTGSGHLKDPQNEKVVANLKSMIDQFTHIYHGRRPHICFKTGPK